MDAAFTQSLNGYVRYQRTTGILNSPDGLTGRLLVADQQPDNFVAALTQTYGTKVINESKFGINRADSQLKTSFPSVSGSNIDFSTSAFVLTGGIVQPGVNGGAATGFSSPGGLTRQSSAGNGRAQPIRPATYNFIDTLTYLQGNHQIKAGVEFRRLNVNFDQLGGTSYSYGNLSDFILNQNLTAGFIGDLSGTGSFRVATDPITTITRDKQGLHTAQQNYYIGFAQDEWKIRPNFTMNAGLRYEYYTPVKEKDGRAIVLDAATGQFRSGSSQFYQSSKKNFGPRLAFTWAPKFLKDKTVIRVGGGLYYGPGQFEDLIQPIESDVLRVTTAFAGGLDATVPGRVSTIAAPVTGLTPRAYDFNGYRVPERIGQYGLSIQQQLPGNTVLTMAYVGQPGPQSVPAQYHECHSARRRLRGRWSAAARGCRNCQHYGYCRPCHRRSPGASVQPDQQGARCQREHRCQHGQCARAAWRSGLQDQRRTRQLQCDADHDESPLHCRADAWRPLSVVAQHRH
ncbi:MAG: TonB-dependent receptor domain-containing protein, partial [Blastocatellia bacterium]